MEDNRLQLHIEETAPPVIHAAGELDYENCSGLDSMIRTAFDKCDAGLNLSLEGLSFVDSSGLRVLVKAALDARRAGCDLNIISMPPHLDRMLDISGFRHLFSIQLPAREAESQVLTEKRAARPSLFSVASDKSACREARDQVWEYASQMGFDTTALDDIKLAVGEAISNAVRHGACQGDPISIACQDDGARLTITLRYPSEVFDPHSVPIPTSSTAAEGGMGIYFMKLVMDGVHYRFDNGYTVLTLAKQLVRTECEAIVRG